VHQNSPMPHDKACFSLILETNKSLVHLRKVHVLGISPNNYFGALGYKYPLNQPILYIRDVNQLL
jgi:hypothetical protein